MHHQRSGCGNITPGKSAPFEITTNGQKNSLKSGPRRQEQIDLYETSKHGMSAIFLTVLT